MVDIAADDVAPDRARLNLARSWRALTVLLLLSILSFAAVSDQTGERRECGPFTIGVSPVGGCDWLE
jgi:hypothetical protein